MSETKKPTRSVLDGRIDLTSYDGITTGFTRVAQAYLNGEIDEREAAALRAILDSARKTLNDKRKWIRPSINSPTVDAQEEPETKEPEAKEEEAPRFELDHAGPFAIFDGGKK